MSFPSSAMRVITKMAANSPFFQCTDFNRQNGCCLICLLCTAAKLWPPQANNLKFFDTDCELTSVNRARDFLQPLYSVKRVAKEDSECGPDCDMYQFSVCNWHLPDIVQMLVSSCILMLRFHLVVCSSPFSYFLLARV